MPTQTPYLPLFRALVENAHDLLGVLDLKAQIRYLNPSARKLSPTLNHSAIDRSLSDFCHPDDHPRLDAWLQRLRRGDGRELCELRLGREGQWRQIQLSGIRIAEDQDSEVIAISGHDVTQQRAASRALKASEKRYHGAFDYSPIGKALVAVDGHVVEANRALAEMLDCWVSELLGSNLFAHFGIEEQEQLAVDAAALALRREEQCERELQRGGSQPSWLQISMAPIWSEQGELEHLIVQMQDVTARRRAEQSLRETNADLLRSNEELKRFAFVASHDLREPLRGISGAVQLIQRRHAEALPERARELATQAVDGVKRLQALLDDLVAYAEQMRGGAVERATVSCRALLDDWQRQHADRLAAAQATLELGQLPTLLGDAEQLAQLFALLLDNALKFARTGVPPQLRVAARWNQGIWEFTVADNGMGIPPANQEQVFEAFRRLHPQLPGTGMGLATARKIVERHGGRIHLKSVEGEGTQVIFSLPPE